MAFCRFFEEILSEARSLLMSRYNGVTLCIDGDYGAVNLAVPVFALPEDVALGVRNQSFTIINHINIR